MGYSRHCCDGCACGVKSRNLLPCDLAPLKSLSVDQISLLSANQITSFLNAVQTDTVGVVGVQTNLEHASHVAWKV